MDAMLFIDVEQGAIDQLRERLRRSHGSASPAKIDVEQASVRKRNVEVRGQGGLSVEGQFRSHRAERGTKRDFEMPGVMGNRDRLGFEFDADLVD